MLARNPNSFGAAGETVALRQLPVQAEGRIKSRPQELAEAKTIIRRVFRELVPAIVNDVPLAIHEESRCAQIDCTLSKVEIRSFDYTKISFNLRFDTHEMWIGFLRVAVPLRSVGLGRQQVRAAEEAGRALGMNAVNVFPLRSAQSYWLQLGYRPHKYTAKVLSRPLNQERL